MDKQLFHTVLTSSIKLLLLGLGRRGGGFCRENTAKCGGGGGMWTMKGVKAEQTPALFTLQEQKNAKDDRRKRRKNSNGCLIPGESAHPNVYFKRKRE